ncbi:MAG: outer membrane beta-barrel protein [Bacteroidales bacterium]|nr:outer membrane beta-barrel protein [Bacteroidales bacterium]
MKKTVFLIISLFLFTSLTQAQLLSERTNGLVTIGGELFTDFNTGASYDNFKMRDINQGFSAYSMFNFQINESPHFASIGVGFTSHNFYTKGTYVTEPYLNKITFLDVPFDYKRSKINVTYVDIPIEMSFRIKDKFKISAGFKFGILTTGKTKFVGELKNDGQMWRIKHCRMNNLEKYVYSVTLRMAYKSVYIFGAYQFGNTFKDGTGPQIKPLSIGIGVRPF